MSKEWEKSIEWEEEWWGNCVNTLGEEVKQLLYAQKMGLITAPTFKTPYRFELNGISVLDIGGGPVSLLLKCENGGHLVVSDPLPVPNWVKERYDAAGIIFYEIKGEDLLKEREEFNSKLIFDEIWIYNVLPHCENPKKIIENAKQIGKLIRIFEWIDTPIGKGHLSSLTEKELNEWLGGEGKVEQLNGIAHGKAYYGVFPIKK